jgi:hypothetical protein
VVSLAQFTMFLLAMVSNGSYLASILIKSYTWSRLRPVLPWVVGGTKQDYFVNKS